MKSESSREIKGSIGMVHTMDSPKWLDHVKYAVLPVDQQVQYQNAEYDFGPEFKLNPVKDPKLILNRKNSRADRSNWHEHKHACIDQENPKIAWPSNPFSA